MHAKWKRGQSHTLIAALVGWASWVFLIYWQGEISLEGASRALDALLALDFARIPAPFDSLLLDSLLFLISGVFWLFFFGHFVVPLQKLGDIVEVLRTMGGALLGRPPAALFIRNGEAANPQTSRKKGRPRILLLDSASAAVLRNDSTFTRAIGPGLSFARADERIAGTLDLRVQRRALGPLPDEDPFAARGRNEEAASFQARQQRRQETSGLTRDGVEVVPRLEVDFRIEGRARKEDAPYPFQAEFAWRAVAHEGVAPQSPSDARGRQMSWDWLPTHLAADVWRESLRKFSLQELFDIASYQEEGLASSGLELLQELIGQRLGRAIVEDKVDSGASSGRKGSSPEYQLLRSRGIRVLDVRLRELHLDPMRDEARLINEWSETWELRAIQSSVEGSRWREEKERRGQQAAAAEFVRQVSAELYRRLEQVDGEKVLPPDEGESLGLLIRGSQRGAAALPGLSAEVQVRLEQLARWLNGGEDG